jgi:hypothetical protein
MQTGNPGGGTTTQVSNPASGGGTYSVTTNGDVNLQGNVNRQGYSAAYTPPECWLQPQFHQPQSWQQGDPQQPPGRTVDADTFWWYMEGKYPGLRQAIPHIPGAIAAINNDFEMIQKGQNPTPGGPTPTPQFVWWAPNWLSGTAGWACVQGLLARVNMNNGFLDLEPPQQPGAGAGQLTSPNLSALARAALKLPTVKVVTSPVLGKPTYVNLKTYVSVVNEANLTAQDTATVNFVTGGLYLRAHVWTSKPAISITTTAPAGAATVSGIPATGCPATAGGTAQAGCYVTFLQPTATGQHDQIIVTATWTVYWTTSADPGTHQFAQPGTNAGQTNVTVKEIQSVNG